MKQLLNQNRGVELAPFPNRLTRILRLLAAFSFAMRRRHLLAGLLKVTATCLGIGILFILAVGGGLIWWLFALINHLLG